MAPRFFAFFTRGSRGKRKSITKSWLEMIALEVEKLKVVAIESCDMILVLFLFHAFLCIPENTTQGKLTEISG